MDYAALNIRVADAEQAEILTAWLADLPFESFETGDGILKAYIPLEKLAECKEQCDALLAGFGVEGHYEKIESQDWNALWEKNFTPINVDGRLHIRAPFHASVAGSGMEVVINPRMAFGTGHHATTCLMAAALMDEPLTGCRVLDMGCGTGILAIVALKCGAAHADAVDIDEWSERNCVENCAANCVADRVTVMQGDVRRIAGRKYDVIAANINRNVLTADMPANAAALDAGGRLWMSGFLEPDIPVIEEAARQAGLKPAASRLRDGWAAVRCVKE